MRGEGEWLRCQPLGWAYLFLPGLLACAGGGGGGGFSLVVSHFVVFGEREKGLKSFDVARRRAWLGGWCAGKAGWNGEKWD